MAETKSRGVSTRIIRRMIRKIDEMLDSPDLTVEQKIGLLERAERLNSQLQRDNPQSKKKKPSNSVLFANQ